MTSTKWFVQTYLMLIINQFNQTPSDCVIIISAFESLMFARGLVTVVDNWLYCKPFLFSVFSEHLCLLFCSKCCTVYCNSEHWNISSIEPNHMIFVSSAQKLSNQNNGLSKKQNWTTFHIYFWPMNYNCYLTF